MLGEYDGDEADIRADAADVIATSGGAPVTVNDHYDDYEGQG